jgi:DNA (cytosine-5)-methyltransferase 1
MSSTDFETHIIKPLEDCGYIVSWHILDARNFNVPQHRERIFIVGRRKRGSNATNATNATNSINNTTPFSFKSLATRHTHKNIEDILDPRINSTNNNIYINENLECKIFENNGINNASQLFNPPHETPVGFILRAQLSNFTNRKLFSSKGIVGTLATSSPPPIYDEKHKLIRHLSKNELKACQGFPISFKFPKDICRSDVVFYLGNSVCVKVISAIIKEMLLQDII